MTSAASEPVSHAPIKAVIWIYFWLLIWEGALRKWVFPQWSDWLFIVRDPLALLAYILALRAQVFPWRPALLVIAIMIAISIAFAIGSDADLSVVLFGLRTDFFHLPLIFLMGGVLDRDDVVRFGKWTLLLSFPIIFIMWLQFRADPSAWINYGAGGAPGQITGALGKIRPAGPFAFISGPVCFFGLVAAFALYGWLQPGIYSRWLVLAATLATVFAVPVSISRSLLQSVAVVGVFGLAASLRDFRRMPALLGPAVAAGGFFASIANSIYVQAFSARWDAALGGGTVQTGVFDRFFGQFIEPFTVAISAPWTGYGIGLGTVGGGRLQTGQYTFLLAESELARIVLELGPILGFAFIAWRVWLANKLIWESWKVFRLTGDTLAWLIAGATFFNLIDGQWGPATQLGFAVFGAGLVLAAMNEPEPAEDEWAEEDHEPVAGA